MSREKVFGRFERSTLGVSQRQSKMSREVATTVVVGFRTVGLSGFTHKIPLLMSWCIHDTLRVVALVATSPELIT